MVWSKMVQDVERCPKLKSVFTSLQGGSWIGRLVPVENILGVTASESMLHLQLE